MQNSMRSSVTLKLTLTLTLTDRGGAVLFYHLPHLLCFHLCCQINWFDLNNNNNKNEVLLINGSRCGVSVSLLPVTLQLTQTRNLLRRGPYVSDKPQHSRISNSTRLKLLLLTELRYIFLHPHTAITIRYFCLATWTGMEFPVSVMAECLLLLRKRI